jgi:GNAT superfamily N-acetyltransferase
MTPALPTDEIRPLDQQHERAVFSCGDAKLDEYLRSYAGQNMQRRTAFVWVWTRPPSQAAIAYYTLTSTQIDAGILPADVARKLKIRGSNALGATLLGRFAVGAAYQGQSLGTTLCMHALHKALEASNIVSSVGVVLDAYADGAKAFWRKMEFIPLGERDGGMERFFLSMAYIEDLFR